MFFEPAETPYDWNWRLFGIPVRVNPWFWLMSVILGWSAVQLGFEYLLVWVICVFVSILVHELGHVLMGQLFGARGHIVLYSLGGLAIGSSNLSRRWQRVLVFFAGPFAGFVLLGITLVVALLVRDKGLHPLLEDLFDDLYQINLYWGILNLLPIFPLDGGRISRELFTALIPDRGEYFAYGISFVCASLLAANALFAASGRPLIPFLSGGGVYPALLFGSLALSSFAAMQQRHDDRH